MRHQRKTKGAKGLKTNKPKVDAGVVGVFRKLAAPACVFVRVRALACVVDIVAKGTAAKHSLGEAKNKGQRRG